MKKVFMLFSLLTFCFNVCAQKSYINVTVRGIHSYINEIRLTGDIPSDMKNYYQTSEKMLIGDILNILSERGYEVESVCGLANGSDGLVNYLLSKRSSNNANSIRRIYNNDENVNEVARYNLQGIPVSENEKGVQIIVYSNYTTKTVIVQ